MIPRLTFQLVAHSVTCSFRTNLFLVMAPSDQIEWHLHWEVLHDFILSDWFVREFWRYWHISIYLVIAYEHIFFVWLYPKVFVRMCVLAEHDNRRSSQQACHLLYLTLDFEDGGDVSFRNVGPLSTRRYNSENRTVYNFYHSPNIIKAINTRSWAHIGRITDTRSACKCLF
jgi:hypothetical protein